MRHIIPISGKDSLATALVQMEREPNLPYELFFNDVGAELPETYAWLDKVEATLGKKITRVGKSLEEVIDKYGILPSAHVRFCTRETKIEPMEEYIGEDDVTVYFGIRADEDRQGYKTDKDNIHACYPLRVAGIRLEDVYRIVNAKGLSPPKFFWVSLHALVLERLEQQHRRSFGLKQQPQQYLASLPSYVFDSLFAWRSRSNCYFCFFQRLYEWVGLLEHHPSLFDRAEEIETRFGNDQQEKPFTWLSGYPLSLIRKNADRIKRKRARQIIQELQTKRISLVTLDALAVAGCGLFCGK